MRRWLIVFASLLLAHAPLRAADDPGFRELGEALVRSLRDADAVSYAQCWTGIRMVERLMDSPPPGVPPVTPEQRAEMRGYLRQRNVVVAGSLPIILDALERRGISRASLVLKRIFSLSEPTEQHGMRSVSSFDLVIGSDHGDLELHIDDGARVDGAWYFSDQPGNLKIGTAWISLRERPAASATAAAAGGDVP